MFSGVAKLPRSSFIVLWTLESQANRFQFLLLPTLKIIRFISNDVVEWKFMIFTYFVARGFFYDHGERAAMVLLCECVFSLLTCKAEGHNI